MEVKFFSKFVAHHPRNLLHIIQESPRWSCPALFLDASLCWRPSPSLAWLQQTTTMSGEAIQSMQYISLNTEFCDIMYIIINPPLPVNKSIKTITCKHIADKRHQCRSLRVLPPQSPRLDNHSGWASLSLSLSL